MKRTLQAMTLLASAVLAGSMPENLPTSPPKRLKILLNLASFCQNSETPTFSCN